jgi:hypothetical protein
MSRWSRLGRSVTERFFIRWRFDIYLNACTIIWWLMLRRGMLQLTHGHFG